MIDDHPLFYVESTPLEQVREAMKIAFRFPAHIKPEVRYQQHQFVYACYEGIQHSRDVIIEGPTGLGKTRSLVAAVIPFLKENERNRILYLTRTITQIDNIVREIRDITGASPNSNMLLTTTAVFGRARIAEKANCQVKQNERVETEIPCQNCIKSKGKRLELAENIAKGPIPLIVADEEYRAFSEKEPICPSHLMDVGTSRSRIVVATQNKIFDQSWVEEWFGGLENTVVIIDEAHNFLAEASNSSFLIIRGGSGRRFFNAENNSFTYDKTGVRTHYDVDLFKLQAEIDDLFNGAISFVEEHIENNCRPLFVDQESHKKVYEDCYELSTGDYKAVFISRLDAIEMKCGEIRNYVDKTGRSGEFANNIKQAVQALKNIINNPYEFYFKTSYEIGIEFYSIHPRIRTNQAIGHARSAIFTSATLAPVDDVAFLFGKPDALRISIDHIFPAENYKTFFIVGSHSSRGINLSENDVFCDQEISTIFQALRSCIRSASGRNIGVFCSSFAVLSQVIEIIKALDFSPQNCIFLGDIGRSAIYETEREWLVKGYQTIQATLKRAPLDQPMAPHLIEPFMAMKDHPQTTILLGVQGGALSEGVDYRGDAMEMVINIGLPYPSSAAEIQIAQIKRDYWGMHFDESDGFDIDDFTYRQEAFRKLAQSVGRAHRSRSDRAVVVFIDERLLALKNDGANEYDALSTANAKKSLGLLQTPVQIIDQNVVFPKEYINRERGIAGTLQKRSGMFLKSDAISFEEMEEDILKFWADKS